MDARTRANITMHAPGRAYWLQVLNQRDELVCFVQKSTKALIMETALGSGSEVGTQKKGLVQQLCGTSFGPNQPGLARHRCVLASGAQDVPWVASHIFMLGMA
jgi:hypothetical protein